MVQPLNVAMVISADGSAAAKSLDQAKREVQGLGTAARASATGVAALASANDQAAVASQRAAQAAIGQGQAEVQARNAAAAATSALRMQTSNLSFQFQDIGTQLASGQSPFTILAQQLPQLTMHGGRLTGIMGALRQSLAGFVSPLGLLTTGFVLAASAAIDYFSEVEDASADAELTLDEQRTLIRQVADEWGGLVPALAAYADELERADKAGKLAEATAAAIGARFEGTKVQLDAARGALAGVIDEMAGLSDGDVASSALYSAMGELARATKDLEEAQKAGKDEAADYERVNRVLASVLENDIVSSSASAVAAISAYRDALLAAVGAGAQLAQQNALANLGERELGMLGTVPPVFSGGGGFIDQDQLQTQRANATKSQYQIAQEQAARRGRRGGRTDAQRDAERYDQIVAQAERAIEMQMLEAEALGMTGEAADRLRITQELLNQARAAGISLGPEQVAELTALGTAMAEVTAQTQAQSDAMELRRDVITDVIGGIRQAAEDGKITMQELLDISMRVLDRIIDKIQNELIDALMNVSGSGGGGGGLFGFIGELFGFGGGNVSLPATAPIPTAAPRFSAGGYTGGTNPARAAGIVHEAEYVFSAPAVRTIGLGNLERMHRTARSGRGYAEGGFVGGGMLAGGMGAMGGPQRIVLEIAEGPMFAARVRQESRAEAVDVVTRAAPAIASASSARTLKGIANGDADQIMAGRYGTRRQAARKT